MISRTVKVGVAGLDSRGVQMARVICGVPYLELMAVADPRPKMRDLFQKDARRTYDDVAQLCADPDIEAIWITTPYPDHCRDMMMAAQHGKDVVVDKPIALTIEDAERMVEAAEKYKVRFFAGHTASLMASIRTLRRVVTSQELGKLCALNAFTYSEWMFRPRSPGEVDGKKGGDVIHRSGPHQLDVIRLLGGGLIRSVRGTVSEWMPFRQAPGYYSAFMEFEDGTPALVYLNGYGYFSSYEFVPWAGQSRPEAPPIRKALRAAYNAGSREDVDELALAARVQTTLGVEGQGTPAAKGFNSDLGIVIASCERGDIRQSPNGLWIYDDEGRRELTVEGVQEETVTEVQEVYDAIVENRAPIHDGRWAMGTLEVLLAMIQSAKDRREIVLSHQCPSYE